MSKYKISVPAGILGGTDDQPWISEPFPRRTAENHSCKINHVTNGKNSCGKQSIGHTLLPARNHLPRRATTYNHSGTWIARERTVVPTEAKREREGERARVGQVLLNLSFTVDCLPPR